MNDLTTQELKFLNQITGRVALGTKLQAIINSMKLVAVDETPVNAVNATKSLAVTGVVIDGETVTFNNPAVAGSDVYEFLADTAQTKTSPSNIAVDITANTTKAHVTLSLPTQPTAGDTMTLGTKVYTFVPNGTANAEGEVSVGTDLATAKAALLAAINGTDGHNTANTKVSAAAFSSNDSTITALVGGVLGNSIVSTETFAAVGNVFSSATLASGADCTAANAITALVAAITASDTQGVGAADGTGDTVDLTADTAGVSGNAITLAKSMANGAFAGGATHLSGGVDGTVGYAHQVMADASYIYVAVAANTVAGKNWRRFSIGSAY